MPAEPNTYSQDVAELIGRPELDLRDFQRGADSGTPEQRQRRHELMDRLSDRVDMGVVPFHRVEAVDRHPADVPLSLGAKFAVSLAALAIPTIIAIAAVTWGRL